MDFHNPGKFMLHLFSVHRSLFNKSISRYCDGLDLAGSERVLEVGSGTGAVTKFLSRKLPRGGKVVCVDTSKPLMDLARTNLRSYFNIEFNQCAIEELPHADKSFDAAVIHYMLHDVPSGNRTSLIMKASNLLVPGGKLFIKEPANSGHGISVEEIRVIMDRCGFEEQSLIKSRHLVLGKYTTAVFVKKKRN